MFKITLIKYQIGNNQVFNSCYSDVKFHEIYFLLRIFAIFAANIREYSQYIFFQSILWGHAKKRTNEKIVALVKNYINIF